MAAAQEEIRRRVALPFGAAAEALGHQDLGPVQLRVARPSLEEPELRAQVWLMRTEMRELSRVAEGPEERESRLPP